MTSGAAALGRQGLTCFAAWLGVLLGATPAAAQAASELPRWEMPWGQSQVAHAAPGPLGSKLQVWICCKQQPRPSTVEDLTVILDRWQQDGVHGGLIVRTTEEVTALTREHPKVTVLVPDPGDENAIDHFTECADGLVLVCTGADLCYSSHTVDGIDDALRCLTQEGGGNGARRRELQNLRRLPQLITDVIDGGNLDSATASCLKALPNCGRAHAARVLYYWWSEGNLEAAEQTARSSLAQLKAQRVPLLAFADLVLRGGHNSPQLAKEIADALAPFGQRHPRAVRDQLVYLRALLHAGGQHRTAGRIIATLPKLLRDKPLEQLLFVETLMDSETPHAYRDLAEAILAKAARDPKLERWVFCARHKILTRCGDPKAAEKLMVAYRTSVVGQGDLNNDAWYLMVEPQTLGRFNTLALAQTLAMKKLFGDGLAANNRDTLALALFLNGKYDEALEQQRLCVKAHKQRTFLSRLRRYTETRDSIESRR